MYLPFSFLLHAILIPDISSPICLLSPDSVFGDTAHGLSRELQRTDEKKRAPWWLFAMPSLIPFPKLKVNRKFCRLSIRIGSVNTPHHPDNKRMLLGFLAWKIYFEKK